MIKLGIFILSILGLYILLKLCGVKSSICLLTLVIVAVVYVKSSGVIETFGCNCSILGYKNEPPYSPAKCASRIGDSAANNFADACIDMAIGAGYPGRGLDGQPSTTTQNAVAYTSPDANVSPCACKVRNEAAKGATCSEISNACFVAASKWGADGLQCQCE